MLVTVAKMTKASGARREWCLYAFSRTNEAAGCIGEGGGLALVGGHRVCLVIWGMVRKVEEASRFWDAEGAAPIFMQGNRESDAIAALRPQHHHHQYHADVLHHQPTIHLPLLQL
jgi:hypothetical protein